VISFDKVSVRYGPALALAEITEKVPAGQWLAIIGRNGTGKSTLLRAAARLVGHEGTIALGGQPTSRMRRRALALMVAYVPQLPELPPDMTTLDYVLLGRTPHIGYLRTETDADREICAGLLGRMELTPMAGRTLGTLSGGELQRAVLARALAQEAPVLLLDEPTSALDLGRRVAALELVDELRRERSLTVLSVVHDLTLAGQFADRLLLLDDGRVAVTGDPASVLRDDVLARHFGPGLHVLTTPDGERVVVSSRTGRPDPGGPAPEELRPPGPGR
jgi:iron complex transport system ATP-binding protein